MPWTISDLPDLTGRAVVVTGANSGLGLESARALAAKGARVVMTARDPARGKLAAEDVRRTAAGPVDEVRLDLADLGSVRSAAAEIRERLAGRIDVLMNNAGVMMSPRMQTADGFELQLGTNHLGHAALTWLLMPALRAAPASRVVTVSSVAHRHGRVDVNDLMFAVRRYGPMAAYAQSKLANLLFAFELDRRLRANGDVVTSVAAHPGVTHTELAANTRRLSGGALWGRLTEIGARVTSQGVARGVLPQLYAAVAPDVRGGEYFGPTGPREYRGAPGRARTTAAARDLDTARALYDLTAELTGVAPDPR